MNIGATINLLKRLRHEFIDDLPEKELDLDDTNYDRHKCRSAFFGLVGDCLEEIYNAQILRDELSSRALLRYQKYRREGCIHKKENPFGKNFRTETDIRYVNAVLDFIIKQLSAVLNADSSSS
jgi:hypothetical protein